MFQESTFCVVTGASKGIGRSIALSLAERLLSGSHLVLVARNGNLLRELEAEVVQKRKEGLGISIVETDLAKPDNLSFSEWLEASGKRKFFNSALLIQNAASVGDVSKRAKEFTDLKELQTYFDLNFHSFVLLNNAFLEFCKKASMKRTTLVDINSGACFKGHPCFHIYGAAKAARLSFYANLAAEEPELRVLSYSPGPVKTEMQSHLGDKAWSADIRKWSQEGTATDGSFPVPGVVADQLMDLLDDDDYQSGTLVNHQKRLRKRTFESQQPSQFTATTCCVGPDCDGSMQKSEFAVKQQCEEGASCQKTIFHWFDHLANVTRATHAIRSCSFPIGCQETGGYVEGCRKHWKKAAVMGCPHRFCCDADLCNSASGIHNRFLEVILGAFSAVILAKLS